MHTLNPVVAAALRTTVHKIGTISCALLIVALNACTAVTIPATNQYQLSAYSARSLGTPSRRISLQVTPPEAVAGYQTQQMLYIKKPYQLEAFVKNAWKNPPADMLYSLLVRSIAHSHFFYAISTSSYTELADYRLDTQLLALEQNFLKNPSALHFAAKITLVRLSDNQILGSRLLDLHIPCSSDTPYGGVLAANKATQEFTAAVTDFLAAYLR